MRKRLLSSVAALVLACSLVPSVALAGEGDETTIPVTIEIGAGGAPAGTSGDGWTYENDVLVLETGYAFTFAGGTFDASGEDRVWNSGIIVDGTFVDESKGYGSAVRNETSGVPVIAPASEPTPPTPDSRPSSSSATLLAATGDSVLPTVVADIVLLAAGTLAASAIACRKRRASRR